MVRISRRTAIKTAILGGAAAIGATASSASTAEPLPAPADAVGLLYDSTLCIGCKACVVACKAAGNLPADTSGDRLYDRPDDLNSHTRNIIKVYRSGNESAFVKRQCMHCVDPACVGACMMAALEKREHGIVSWDGTRCVGCRYCEVACPYGIPKFEWTTSEAIYNPKIVKCELCRERLAVGQEPACTAVCPRHAVIYGSRGDLLREAKARIAAHPDTYIPRVYGEHEAGGAQVLYLSHVPFEKLGLPTLADESLPASVHKVQGAIYKGFIAPVALYGVLVATIRRHHGATAGDDSGARS
jgi:Fe-S-cluster-containing dehydrogenase component